MNALLLAGGKGSRMGALSNNGCKGMVEVLGKALIEYSLDHAIAMGARRIVIVINDLGGTIRDHYGDYYCGVPLRYATQIHPLGLVDAIEVGAPLLDQDDFALFLSDEVLVGGNHAGMAAAFSDRHIGVMVGVLEAAPIEMIRRNYDVIARAGRRVVRLVEKPPMPRGTLLGLGNCIFAHRILDFLPRVPVNPIRGEKDLTDLIQCAIESGEVVEYFPLCTGYVNVNTPEDRARARRMLEDQLRSNAL